MRVSTVILSTDIEALLELWMGGVKEKNYCWTRSQVFSHKLPYFFTVLRYAYILFILQIRKLRHKKGKECAQHLANYRQIQDPDPGISVCQLKLSLLLCAKQSTSAQITSNIFEEREARGNFCCRNQEHFMVGCVEGEEVTWRLVWT